MKKKTREFSQEKQRKRSFSKYSVCLRYLLSNSSYSYSSVFFLFPLQLGAPTRRGLPISKSRKRGRVKFTVLWRTPVLAGMRLPVGLKLPYYVKPGSAPVQELADSLVERRSIDAGPNGLRGSASSSPASIHNHRRARPPRDAGRPALDNHRPPAASVDRVRSAAPWCAGLCRRVGVPRAGHRAHPARRRPPPVRARAARPSCSTPWMLVKTITAFTVAHSITLAIATLGYEGACRRRRSTPRSRLSILFLGPEIVRDVARTSSSFTDPGIQWVVAFAFGLLHGFGFASGLMSARIPRSARSRSPCSCSTSGSRSASSPSSPLFWRWSVPSACWKSAGHAGCRHFPDMRSARSARSGPCREWRCLLGAIP